MTGRNTAMAQAARVHGSTSARKASAVAPARTLAIGDMFAVGGSIDLDRVEAALGMTRAQIAETAGLARETLQKAGRRDGPKARARLREMLEVIQRVQGWAGGLAQAMAWYRAEPIPAFGGRTAEALVKSGDATALRDYLDHVATGGYA
jgi:hypothetical protein